MGRLTDIEEGLGTVPVAAGFGFVAYYGTHLAVLILCGLGVPCPADFVTFVPLLVFQVLAVCGVVLCWTARRRRTAYLVIVGASAGAALSPFVLALFIVENRWFAALVATAAMLAMALPLLAVIGLLEAWRTIARRWHGTGQ